MKSAVACLVCAFAAGIVQAEEGAWRLQGDTTLRVDRYEERGNPALSRFPHTGTQAYQDLNLQLSGRPDDDAYWEFNVSGALSESDYRTRERGLTPEWIHLRHENSGGPLPYRLDLGDQYAHFSTLTLDRRLQAARLEVQPFVSADRRHSLVWISGRDRTNWRGEPTGSEDTFHGASWMVQDADLGRYAVNVVRSSVGSRDGHASLPDDTQLVASLAAAWDMDVYRQQLDAEAELAWQDGQAVPEGPDEDRGLRVSMAGSDEALPLDYTFRYERYGRGFKPAGVSPGRAHRMADSRTLKAGGGWRFGSGLEVRGGYDRYVDNVSYEPLTVNDWHVRLLAPETFGWAAWADQEWMLRLRNRDNGSDTVDTRSREMRWDMNIASGEHANTRLRFRYLDLADRVSGLSAYRERQYALTHSQRFRLGPVDMYVTPGVDVRRRDGSGEVTVAYPTLSVNAAAHNHHVGLRLGFREFLRPEGVDLDEYSLKLDYRYQFRSHTFGMELDHLLREPALGDDADSWRAGLYWRYNFDYGF